MAKGPQAEYTNLVGYFKNLVWLTGISLTVLVAVAGFLFYSSLRDARADAKLEATRVAAQEAQESVKKAFDEKNVNDLIQKAAQEKIATITDKMIEQQLTSKLQPIQKRILAIGEISEIEIRVRRGSRSGLEELVTLITKTSDPDTLQFAKSTLQTTAHDYELSAEDDIKTRNTTPYFALRAEMNRPQEGKTMPDKLPGVVELINKDQDLDEIALAFLAFQELTGQKVRMFDFGAVKRWCASNEAKCK